tara:strand:- start:348 stop:536 length:189 start_codon:yes stop_codon:yes gene_type:complete
MILLPVHTIKCRGAREREGETGRHQIAEILVIHHLDEGNIEGEQAPPLRDIFLCKYMQKNKL